MGSLLVSAHSPAAMSLWRTFGISRNPAGFCLRSGLPTHSSLQHHSCDGSCFVLLSLVLINWNSWQAVARKHVKDLSASFFQQMKIFPNPALQCSGSISKNAWKTTFDILNSDILKRKKGPKKGVEGNFLSNFYGSCKRRGAWTPFFFTLKIIFREVWSVKSN